MDNNNINIIQWNSQSVKPKLVEFEQLLSRERIHIATLSETWLSPGPPKSKLKINGYNIFRADRHDSYGGVAIFTHRSIKAQLGSFQNYNSGIEVIYVKIFNCPHIENILSVYCAPSVSTVSQDWDQIFSTFSKKTLILGDFNGHHPSWSCKVNPRGTQIFDSLLENNYVTLNNRCATRIKIVQGVLQESSPDISTATTDIATRFDWSVMNEHLGSDHLVIKIKMSYYNHSPQNLKKRNFKKANWELYTQQLNEKFKDFILTEDLQNNYDTFITNINEIAEIQIPYLKISQDPIQKFVPKPYWSVNLSKAVAERRLALTVFRKNPTPENLDTLKNKSQSAQKLIRQARSKGWRNMCSSICESTTVSEVWRRLKWLKGCKQPTCHVDKSVASRLLCNLSPDYVSPNSPVFTSVNLQLECPINISELKACIKNKDTSPGIDNISYSMIKKLPENGIDILVQLFNQFLVSAFVPIQWRKISIVPIPKPGRDPLSISALRPISLISCMCKLFHMVIRNRLEWFLEKNEIFHSETTGFRKSKSTIDNLSNLVTRIQHGFSKDQITLGCFIDIENAYNNIDVCALLQILDRLKVGSKICYYLWSFLRERYLSIQVNNTFIIRSTNRGIAQGDPLSPLLFNVATISICNLITNVYVSQYADDFALYTVCKSLEEATSKLQQALDKIALLLRDLALEISPSKSKVCIFKKGINRHSVSLNINNLTLQQVDVVKYLGMWLDRSLRWKKHINALVDKIPKYLNVFKALAGSEWGVHPKHLRRLYIALIRSRMDYGSFLYNNSCQNHLYKLDKFQNQSLRIIGGFIKTTPIHVMESELCLPPLFVRRKYLGSKYWLKCRSFSNNITINLLNQLSQYDNHRYWHNKKEPLLLSIHNSLQNLRIYSSQRTEMFAMDTWISNLNLSDVIKVHLKDITEAKRQYNIFQLNNMCTNFINREFKNYYKIFTDGSKDGSSVGAAFLDAQANTFVKFKIKENICIMNAELIAICEALSYAKSLDNKRNFVIFTDSKSALQHLARCTSAIRGTPIAYSILELVQDLKRQSKSIVLQWIPSHCYIEENDKVDILAKQACGDGLSYNILPFYTDCIYLIKKQCYIYWKEYFDERSKEKGIWYKTVQPHPPKIPWIDNKLLNRVSTVTAMRLRSGHIPSKKFAFLMKKATSPNCPDCNIYEDTYHILMECIRNDAFRKSECLHIKETGSVNCILSNPITDEAKLIYKLYDIGMRT
ncbi:hypothetical protein O3G_MSEX008208 [Manduca sexta]|uniref:RNA-directed DNA polymerase from mobile element jockey n=1 Tax=Manduca sexta TaxID=7130 RepID=A0A922CP88_MANSE|nr:hypothetical protein O3G_MSEX008208 [Manduca sexta]